MKFVNQLRKSSSDDLKQRASRPVIIPKKNGLKAEKKKTEQEDNFLFI